MRTPSSFRKVATRNTDCPEPGVYYDMPAEVYHDIDALNASSIKDFVKSGLHGAHGLEKVWKPGEALWFGSAFHSAALEPKDFAERVHLYEQTGIGASADVAHRKYLEEHPDSIPMRKGWQEKIETMTKRIMDHPDGHYLCRETDGANEVTFIWDIEREVMIDGALRTITVPCKARVDRFIKSFSPYRDAHDVAGIVDVKTAKDSSMDAMERSIANFGYYIQAAWYLAGAIKLGMLDTMHDHSYQIIAVEKSAPYPVGIYPINTTSLQYGLSQCLYGLRAYVKYRMLGHKPGPTDTVTPVGLPVWAQPASGEIPEDGNQIL